MDEFKILLGAEISNQTIDAIQTKINQRIKPIDLKFNIDNRILEDLTSRLNRVNITPNVDLAGLRQATEQVNALSNKQINVFDKNGNEKLVRDVTRIQSHFGQVVDIVRSLNSETQNLELSTSIVSTNFDKIAKSTNDFATLKSTLQTSIGALTSTGNFNDGDLQKLNQIGASVQAIQQPSENSIKSLKQLQQELKNVVVERIKFGDLSPTNGLKFDSNVDEIKRYVSGLKSISEEYITVDKQEKLIRGSSLEEMFKRQTVTVKEADGTYKKYIITLNSLNNQIRMTSGKQVSVNSLSDDEALIKARQLKQESDKLYSQQEASLKTIYALKIKQLTADGDLLNTIKQRLAYEGRLKNATTQQIVDNPALKNAEKEIEYTRTQIRLKNELTQAIARQQQAQNDAIHQQALSMNNMYDKNKLTQSALISKIDTASFGSISPQDQTALNNIKNGLQQVSLSSATAKQEIRDFNVAFMALKSDIGRGKLVEQGSLLDINSSKADIAQYIASWQGVEAAQVRVKQTGTEGLQSLGNQIKKFAVEIANADGSVDQLALSLKAVGNNKTDVRAIEKGVKDTGVGMQDAKAKADALGRSIKQTLAYFFSFSIIISEIRKGTKTILELDKAFNEIRMITGDSVNETKKLRQEYGFLANQIASTTLEVAASGNEWVNVSPI